MKARVERRHLFALSLRVAPYRGPGPLDGRERVGRDAPPRTVLDDERRGGQAYGGELLDLGQIKVPGGVAGGRRWAHGAIGRQHAQRFTHRAAAHAELLAEALLGEPVLGRVLPGDDALLERRNDRAAE